MVAFLLGTWTGTGRGSYPTIDAFEYGEEVVYRHVGKPFLAYSQRTWALDDGRPMHGESGFLRPVDGYRLELLLAYPTGHVEVAEGAVDGKRIELRSTGVAKAATAKDVTMLQRTIEVTGDQLTYSVQMAAVGLDLQPHLEAMLKLSAG